MNGVQGSAEALHLAVPPQLEIHPRNVAVEPSLPRVARPDGLAKTSFDRRAGRHVVQKRLHPWARETLGWEKNGRKDSTIKVADGREAYRRRIKQILAHLRLQRAGALADVSVERTGGRIGGGSANQVTRRVRLYCGLGALCHGIFRSEMGFVLAHEIGHFHDLQVFRDWCHGRTARRTPKFPAPGRLKATRVHRRRCLAYGLNVGMLRRCRVNFKAREENYAEAFAYTMLCQSKRVRSGSIFLDWRNGGWGRRRERRHPADNTYLREVLRRLVPTMRLIDTCLRQTGVRLTPAQRRKFVNECKVAPRRQ